MSAERERAREVEGVCRLVSDDVEQRARETWESSSIGLDGSGQSAGSAFASRPV